MHNFKLIISDIGYGRKEIKRKMNISNLTKKIQKNPNTYIQINKYGIQIYSSGKAGNICRSDGTVVCRFNITDEKFMIAPAKEDAPYEVGYNIFSIEIDEKIEAIGKIAHKDSDEIFHVFQIYVEEY